MSRFWRSQATRLAILGSLLTCLGTACAGSYEPPLCLSWPPWRCEKPQHDNDLERRRAEARARFEELYRPSLGEFEQRLNRLWEDIERGIGEKGLDPDGRLVKFISGVEGPEEDIVLYLLENDRPAHATLVVKWLVKKLGWRGLPSVYPLGAHAHNDYEHEVPLLNAMVLGFDSVEADLYVLRTADIRENSSFRQHLKREGLCGCRERIFLLRHLPSAKYAATVPFAYLARIIPPFFAVKYVYDPENTPTFEEYYLRPLVEGRDKFSGMRHVPLRIVVDFKRVSFEMFDPFLELVEEYKNILTRLEWKDGRFTPHDGQAQILISGFDGFLRSRPTEEILELVCNEEKKDVLVFLDGRSDDDESMREKLEACGAASEDVVPMVSARWSGVSRGEIERVRQLPPDERGPEIERLASKLNVEDIARAHRCDARRPIRLFNEPKSESEVRSEIREFRTLVWEIQYQACVDVINADELLGLHWFLLKKRLLEREDPASIPNCRAG